jgi:hypothetical protein
MNIRDYHLMLYSSASGLSSRYPENSQAWRFSMAFWLNYYRKTLPRLW